MSDRWMPLKEVAAKLGRAPKTLYNRRSASKDTPPLSKRAGVLGCPESVFNHWLLTGENKLSMN